MAYEQKIGNYSVDLLSQQTQTVKNLEAHLKEIYQRIRFFKPSVLRFFIFEAVSFWILFPPIYYATQINFVLSFLCGILTPLVLYSIGLLANKIKYKLNYYNVQLSISQFKDNYNSCLISIRSNPQYITQELSDDIFDNGRYRDASSLSLHDLKIFLTKLVKHYEKMRVRRKCSIAPQVELQSYNQNAYGLGLNGKGDQNNTNRPPCVEKVAALSTAHPSQMHINASNPRLATVGL